MNKYKNIKAFSLIELLIALALIGILVSLASQMSNGLAKKTANGAYRLLVKDISQARTFAGDPSLPYSSILLIPKDGGSNSDWLKGWEIRANSPSGQLLHSQSSFETDSVSITSNEFSKTTPMFFSKKGYANKTGQFTSKHTPCGQNTPSYIITVAKSGLTHTKKESCTP